MSFGTVLSLGIVTLCVYLGTIQYTMTTETPEVSDCIFCNIVNGSAYADIVYQNENILVFRDIRPAAKNHLLAIPKIHIKDAKCLTSAQKPLVENMVKDIKEAMTSLGDNLSDVRYGFHWPPFNSISHLHLHAISPVSEMSYLSKNWIFRENSYWFVSPEYVLSRL